MALSVFYSRGATTYDSLGLQSEVASWFPRKSRSDGMRKGHMSPPRGFHSFNGSQPPVKTPGYHLSSLRDASVATCNVQRATCNVQRATCNVQRAGKSKSVLSTNGSSNSGEYQYSQIGILFRDCSIEQLTFLCGLRSTVFAAGPDVVCGEASSDIERLRSQRA